VPHAHKTVNFQDLLNIDKKIVKLIGNILKKRLKKYFL